MEDLKTILETNISIVDINNKVNKFIDSAKDFDDKLKLAFVALNQFFFGMFCQCFCCHFLTFLLFRILYQFIQQDYYTKSAFISRGLYKTL